MESRRASVFETAARPRRLVLSALVFVCCSGLATVARADVDLWPFLEISDSGTTVLYPFYVHEGNFLMIFPFYYRTNEGRDHHFLWPFVKVHEGRLSRAAPIWFSEEEDHFLLVPLAYRTPEETFFLIPPIYMTRDERVLAVLPFYVRARASEDEEKVWIAWRLFGWFRERGGTDYFAGYLFDYGSHAEQWNASLFPVLWTWGGSEDRGFILPPGYFRHTATTRFAGVAPLFHREYGPDSSALWLMPYYGSQGPGADSATALLPFFWTSQTHDRSADTTTASEWIAWPLYRRIETTRASGEVVSRERGFLFFSDELEHQERTFSVLGIAVTHESE
jgi:hypothetical protein